MNGKDYPAFARQYRHVPENPVSVSPEAAALVRYLSPERLRPYMVAADHRTEAALELYQWNMAASAAVYEVLHLAEVVLRNAKDHPLREWNTRPDDREPGVTHSPHWAVDPCLKLQRILGNDLVKAQARARSAVAHSHSPGRPVAHGDVVAQLMLGSWRYLLPPRNLRKSPTKSALWSQALVEAFPHRTGDHAALTADVETLWLLRNRVAHLEPLIRPQVIENGAEALRRVIAAIEPSLCAWHDKQSRISYVLALRPPGAA